MDICTEHTIDGVYENFTALTHTLRNGKEDGEAVAIGLLKQVFSKTFLSVLYDLHQVLPLLGHLSRAFQKGVCLLQALPLL